ncbi:MAG: DJ-1/PfpI family protein [Muribaculaceae bacterium]|jgi:4-methyl-5(b-hydroxyethyl)-thiazole monophosphate biosynthesis|nr:DJ-1/PfpI family protein [Muribaculaceae bacterium]
MQKSYIFLADGFEEIEALAPLDILRRAGMPVITVSISDSLTVTGAHGARVEADALFTDNDMSAAEWLILPGGMPGASNLAACKPLTDLLVAQAARGGKIAAICASPALVLAPLGILNGIDATCYPGMATNSKLIGWKEDEPVVSTNRVITAHGPGASMLFGLTIAAISTGQAHAHEIGEAMMVYPRTMNQYF